MINKFIGKFRGVMEMDNRDPALDNVALPIRIYILFWAFWL